MKRDTLLWRLATVYGGLDDRCKYEETMIDIYTLVKYVLTGIWRIFLILLFAFVASIILGDFLAWVAASIATSAFVTPSPVAVVGISFFLLVAMFFAVYLGDMVKDKLKEHKSEDEYTDEDDQPSLISKYIQSIKDKTCYTVHVKPLEDEK